MRLEGIHHVTAITADVLQNVDFYTRVLGLRLVGKSVNQDEPSVYHVFFSDELGQPGSDITFFEYRGAPRGRAGAGMVHRVLWRVASEAALEFWQARLEREGAPCERAEGSLRFADRDGLAHELVVAHVPDAPRIAEHPSVPHELALQGFHGVRAYGARLADSARVLEEVLGAKRAGEASWELRGESRGGTIAFDPPPEARGLQGAGTVHHVAWASTVAEHPHWLERLAEHGVRSTPVIDRHFFRSIYFREPGGVLYEIADDGPGFGSEPELGRKLALPPWLEPRRAELEAKLRVIPDPRAAWSAG